MIILGIVGTPAGGKSTVARYLSELGAEWINADLIARECLNHPEVVRDLVSRFGDGIVSSEQLVDRAKIADLVFGNDPIKRENLQFLESVVHPRTRIEIQRRITDAACQTKQVALLDVPLLFESGWDRGCDSIWCIDAKRSIRLRRSKNRGWDANELDRRELNQLPIKTKCRLSNVVMRNETTLDSLHQNLRLQWDLLVRMGSTDQPAAGIPHDRQGLGERHCTSDRT